MSDRNKRKFAAPPFPGGSIYSFEDVPMPQGEGDEFERGWQAAMRFASAHTIGGPKCRVKDRGWDNKGKDATGRRCTSAYNHDKGHETTEGIGKKSWPRHEDDDV